MALEYKEYRYFTIPYDAVPQNPSYQIWYAVWSDTRPTLEPGTPEPMVVGCTTTNDLPAGAILLGTSTKTPDPPPPPPPLASTALTAYQTSFGEWLAARRGG